MTQIEAQCHGERRAVQNSQVKIAHYGPKLLLYNTPGASGPCSKAGASTCSCMGSGCLVAMPAKQWSCDIIQPAVIPIVMCMRALHGITLLSWPWLQSKVTQCHVRTFSLFLIHRSCAQVPLHSLKYLKIWEWSRQLNT